MTISKKDRRHILRNYPARSVKELAGEVGASPDEIQSVLESAGVEIRESKPALPLMGFCRAHPLGVALLVAVVSVVYLNTMRNGFHYDDIHSLLQNLGVQVEWSKNPESRKLFYQYFYKPELFSSRPNVAMPRPILMCTFGLNYVISRYEPWSWVLVNVLLHMANSIIIYVGLCHLSGRRRIALLTALIFAIHPINTETVNYINCRSESLTVLFMLLTMYFFTRSLRDDRLDLKITCFVIFAIALLTKELAFVLPATLAVIDLLFVYPVNKDRVSLQRRVTGWYGPILAIWIAYFIYRKLVLDTFVIERQVRPLWDNWLTQARILVGYIRLFFYPIHQNISYENMVYSSADFVHNPFTGGILPSILLLAGLIALGIAWYRKRPVVSFAVANFFITLSITSIIPLNAIMNEHRPYLPSLGGCLLMAIFLEWTASQWRERRGQEGNSWPAPIQALTLAILLMLGALTINRNFSFHSDLTVWRDSIMKSPLKAQVVSDLGNAYYRGGRKLTRRGDFAEDKFIDKAEKAEIDQMFRVDVPLGGISVDTQRMFEDVLYIKGLNRAEQLYLWGIRVERGYYKAWHNLGTINYTYALVSQKGGDKQKVLNYLERAGYFFQGATQISPNGESFNDWASTLMKRASMTEDDDPEVSRKLLDQAEQLYHKAVEYNPELYKALVNLAIIYDKDGRTEKALQLIERAIKINPVDTQLYYYKGQFLLKLKRHQEAIQTFQKCLSIDRGNNACLQGLERVKRQMNTGPGPELPP